MNQQALISRISTLISRWENEVFEFKNVSDSYPTSDIGNYFSAMTLSKL